LNVSRKSARRNDIAIVGLGNWGTSLAAALTHAHIPPREIIVRRRKPSVTTVSWKNACLDARILWLCVPDSAVPETAAQIVRRRRDLHGQIVVHSSGALTTDALEPVRRAGAAVASVHPVMTFPTRHAVPLDGVLFAVEAANAATRRTLHALIRKFGGIPFDVASKNKALYHAAGTLASPLLVSQLTAAMETARLAGLDPKIASHWVEALAMATTRNFFTRGPSRSFSGPFVRGDATTIRLHLQALQKHQMLADIYRSLALHALATLPVRNAQALFDALRNSSAQQSQQPVGEEPGRTPRMRH
jgi:predicted short-subunit dehydrogenase-like oxidoreductase (DUF2520 family)